MLTGSFICPAVDQSQAIPTLWQIYGTIALEAFFWGAGTAIGELPPYFVARAARRAGQRLKTVEEDEPEEPGFVGRLMEKVEGVR